MAMHVAPRLTEQDPRMAAGTVEFDWRPAVLPVSVDVSGIDMQTVRHAEPTAEPVVAPAERKQEFRGPMWLDDIDPELEGLPGRIVVTGWFTDGYQPHSRPVAISGGG